MSLEAELLTEQVVGMSKQDAEEMCREAGVRVRITSEDGVNGIFTMEFNDNRLNLTVKGGIVTAARVG